MKTFACLALCSIVFVIAPSLRADVTTDYTLFLNPGTSAGNPITNLMIFEVAAGSAQLAIDFGGSANGFTIPASGIVQLSHTSAFVPAASFVIGLTQQVGKLSLVMFVNDNFAQNAAGIPFNNSFLSITHNALIARLQAAEAGSQTDLDWFRDSFYPLDGSRAAFATGTSPTAIEFTGGVIIGTVPDQSSSALLLTLAAGLLVAAKRYSARLA